MKTEHDLRESEELPQILRGRPDGRLHCEGAGRCSTATRLLYILGFPGRQRHAVQRPSCSLPEVGIRSSRSSAREEGREYEIDLVRPDGADPHERDAGLEQIASLLNSRYMYDITERKSSSRCASLTRWRVSVRWRAVVAHDFNNILNNVIGFVLQIKKHAGT
jgi:hypothetical protein